MKSDWRKGKLLAQASLDNRSYFAEGASESPDHGQQGTDLQDSVGGERKKPREEEEKLPEAVKPEDLEFLKSGVGHHL